MTVVTVERPTGGWVPIDIPGVFTAESSPISQRQVDDIARMHREWDESWGERNPELAFVVKAISLVRNAVH